MSLRSDFPWLAERELAMRAIERAEGSELEPACVELTPLLVVGVLLAGPLPLLLSCNITILHAEASDVHCPVWNAADSEVQTC